MLAPQALLLAAPVIDLDGTVFVQAGIFLGLMVVLHFLLFKPWLEVRDRRREAIEGSLLKAGDLKSKASELEREYETAMKSARDKATGVRSDANRDAEASRAKTLADARSTAAAELETTRTRLDAQASAARGELTGRVEDLARDITNKLLGRAA